MEEQKVFIPESEEKEVESDLVIIGGGPAGLSAGIYAARSGMDSVVIEKGVLGGQVAITPIVENYPGLTQIGGKALVDIMVTHALEYVQIFPGEKVEEVKPGQPIFVQTSRRKFYTKALLIATGSRYKRLNVPGESDYLGAGVHFCATCDGPFYKGKRVAVIGGGNSATEESLLLTKFADHVSILVRKDRFKATQVIQEKVLSHPKIDLRWHTEVKEFIGKDSKLTQLKTYDSQTGAEEILPIDMTIPFEDLRGQGEKVLVVDDVKSQRDISSKMLDMLGYSCEVFSSGEEAIEYLKENKADLIVLDMIMDPGINGRETYERVIKLHPDQKAIIVSGYAETEEVTKAQQLGAGKYIKKPLTLEKIGVAVKEELSKTRT